jgi:hypothetical protein
LAARIMRGKNGAHLGCSQAKPSRRGGSAHYPHACICEPRQVKEPPACLAAGRFLTRRSFQLILLFANGLRDRGYS